MSRVIVIAVLLAAVITMNAADVLCVVAKDPDLYLGPIGLVELKKPRHWHFLNTEDIKLQAELKALTGNRFLGFVKYASPSLLVSATKYAEPLDAFNPGFEVSLLWNENPDSKATEILQSLFEERSSQQPGYKLLEPVSECEIAGLPASCAVVAHNAQNPALEGLPLVSIQYIVSRGPYMYMIVFSGRPKGTDSIGPEVDVVLESVRFLE